MHQGYVLGEPKVFFIQKKWVQQGSIPRTYLLALVQSQDCGDLDRVLSKASTPHVVLAPESHISSALP